jgi:Domain of unknown function (DUF5710)
MRQWLDVPISEKDLAKACGARWDPDAKRWYAPRPGMRGLDRWAARPDLPVLLPGEDRTFGEGLFVDLVPESCWFKNARTCIAPQDWDRVRRMVTGRADRRCEACGRGEDPSRGLRLEAHERWEFSGADRRQILRRLVCFCTGCHKTTHYGLAGIRGETEQAFAHLCAVTGMSWQDAEDHVREAGEVWLERSAVQWELDLSILTGAGVAIVRPAGSGADRAQTARELTSHARPPAEQASVTQAGTPQGPGSRWERWLQTGER